MNAVAITMPDGAPDPQFVQAINQQACIGCGRCFKVCGRDVLQLAGVSAEGGLIPIAVDFATTTSTKRSHDDRQSDELHRLRACSAYAPRMLLARADDGG